MSILVIPAIFVLPPSANIPFGGNNYVVNRWKVYVCIMIGLWTGLIIGFITEYYTSNKYSPVKNLVEACRMGPAPNIILGLALGYSSTIVPILALAFTVYYSFTLLECLVLH